MSSAHRLPREPADRPDRTLWTGILVFRWAALVWMAVLAATAGRSLLSREIAWIALIATVTWVVVLTTLGIQDRPTALWFDLFLSAALLAVSGLLVPEGTVDDRPLFGTAYPVAAALAWGAAWGPWAGFTAGSVLGMAYVLARPLNGIVLDDLTAIEIQGIAATVVNFLLAGGGVGLIARLLARSTALVRAANEDAVESSERAARLAERESLARTIHDSVLQSLALVHKRTSELGAETKIEPREVRVLGDIVAQQEHDLRRLILRPPEETPSDMASLRDALEAMAITVPDASAEVAGVGPVLVPRLFAREITAAAREALLNVAKHAEATRTNVFATHEDGAIAVTVRDDGVGFEYDEPRLRAAGRAGILNSIVGRIEALGGSVRILSASGRGTEVEMRVPVEGSAT